MLDSPRILCQSLQPPLPGYTVGPVSSLASLVLLLQIYSHREVVGKAPHCSDTLELADVSKL